MKCSVQVEKTPLADSVGEHRILEALDALCSLMSHLSIQRHNHGTIQRPVCHKHLKKSNLPFHKALGNTLSQRKTNTEGSFCPLTKDTLK